jgi:hypothetical protein
MIGYIKQGGLLAWVGFACLGKKARKKNKEKRKAGVKMQQTVSCFYIKLIHTQTVRGPT